MSAKFTLDLLLQYNGYPESRAAKVIEENITGDEDWNEDLLARLKEEGISCQKATLKSAYQPTTDDGFVCLRVPIHLECEGDENEAFQALNKFCEREVDSSPTFYCDSCWVE